MTNSFGKTASELLDELKADKVGVTLFHLYGKWHYHLEKENEGIHLQLKDSSQEGFLSATRVVYDKWYLMLEGKMSQHLGVPQIEHKTEEKIQAPQSRPTASESIRALHEAAQGQETVEEAPGTDPDMQF